MATPNRYRTQFPTDRALIARRRHSVEVDLFSHLKVIVAEVSRRMVCDQKPN